MVRLYGTWRVGYLHRHSASVTRERTLKERSGDQLFETTWEGGKRNAHTKWKSSSTQSSVGERPIKARSVKHSLAFFEADKMPLFVLFGHTAYTIPDSDCCDVLLLSLPSARPAAPPAQQPLPTQNPSSDLPPCQPLPEFTFSEHAWKW
jgi:hypothetical protein